MTQTALTREQVMAMEPGQKLDELISNHVFKMDMVAHVHYSTNVETAWMILNELESEEWSMSVSKNDCHFYLQDQGLITKTTGVIQAESTPEAICKAALLAVLDL